MSKKTCFSKECVYRIISGKVFTSPSFGLGGDCVQIFGSDGFTVVENCIFDLSAVPTAKQDEAIDLLCVVWRFCRGDWSDKG